MLINKFLDKKPILIQCQNNYISPFSDIAKRLNSKKKLNPHETTFVDGLETENVTKILNQYINKL